MTDIEKQNEEYSWVCDTTIFLSLFQGHPYAYSDCTHMKSDEIVEFDQDVDVKFTLSMPLKPLILAFEGKRGLNITYM